MSSESTPVRLVGAYVKEISTSLIELVEQLELLNEKLERIATEAERDYP